MYYKFSVIECLNMQIRHYLIKYALIYKSEHWIGPGLIWARFKIRFSLCLHIRWGKNYRGIFL